MTTHEIDPPWSFVALDEVLQHRKAGYWGAAHPGEDQPIQVEVVRNGDISERGELLSTATRFFSEAEADRSELRTGDVLLTTSGQVGKALLITDPAVGLRPSNFVRALRPDHSKVLPAFLHFALSFEPLRAVMSSHSQGSTIKNLKTAFFSDQCLPLPAMHVQRAIAHVLRTVQRAREQTEQVIAAAKELKKSLMRHLLTYGPGQGSLGSSATGETEFGEVPGHWQVLPLADCAAIQPGVAKGRNIDKASAIEVPYLRVANVQDGFLDLREIKTITIRAHELDRFALQCGDILLTEGGDFDKLGRGHIWRGQISPCVHQNHLFAVRPDPRRAMPEYVSYLMQSSYAKRYFLKVAHRTTHLACINKTKLERFPVLLPPAAEQQQLVRTFERLDDKIAAEEQRRDALAALFDSLLHNLMTGKLRVDHLAAEFSR